MAFLEPNIGKILATTVRPWIVWIHKEAVACLTPEGLGSSSQPALTSEEQFVSWLSRYEVEGIVVFL